MSRESKFHDQADAVIEAIGEEIEAKDKEMLIDVDNKDSVLTLTLDSGDEFVISKHAPMQQIWLSSPFSGGLHYDYVDADSCWTSARNGSALHEHLAKELNENTGLKLAFPASGD